MESTVTKSEDCQAASFSHKCHHFLGFFLLVEISLHACARAAKNKNFSLGGKKITKNWRICFVFFLLILHSWFSASLVLQLFFLSFHPNVFALTSYTSNCLALPSPPFFCFLPFRYFGLRRRQPLNNASSFSKGDHSRFCSCFLIQKKKKQPRDEV
jgi:hypothetical protein